MRSTRFLRSLARAAVLATVLGSIGCAQGGTPGDGGRPPGTDGGGECGASQMRCGTACVSLEVDPNNCGACGLACADGERCQAGACVVSCPRGQDACEVGGFTACVSTTSDPANCGGCGNACASGEVCSAGACGTSCGAGLATCTLAGGGAACADLATDAAHCGDCDTACGAGQSCSSGTCEVVCPSGQSACGGLCVNLSTDDENCGMCGTACGASEACEGGACVTRCPSGTTDCGGICRDTTSDSSHCGGCDMACGAGEICVASGCTLSCPGGQTACSGSCVFTDRDPLHCGACGMVCPAPVGGSASCSASSCTSSCPSGQTDCSGTCRDTSSDSSHCGACGRACASGEVCSGASCVPDLPPIGGPTFRIDALGAVGCGTLDHTTLTGDDRGGIAVSTSQVFVSGDDATARFSRTDLSGGVALSDQLDAMVTNVRNGYLYTLADDSGPLLRGGGTITQLLRLSSINAQVASSGHVRLSTPITAAGSVAGATVGIFAGYDRVVIHNGTRVYSIDLNTGAVSDLGAMGLPARRGCENWAYWGIAETDGASTNLIFASSNTLISKVRVPTGAVVQSFTFSNLSDMCSISAYVPANRWYFHHEYTSQFVSTPSSEHVGYCNATFSTATGFTVTSMTGTACATYDHNTLTGDDRGGIAVSSSYVFYTGDTATGRFSRSSFPPATADRVGRIHDAMISNLRTGQVYVLGSGGRPLSRGGGTVTQLILLSATSGLPTTSTLTLSMPIDVTATYTGSTVGFFSGYDRAVIHNGSRVFHVDLTSGAVTDLGTMAVPGRATCENWAYWGVAELFGGQLWLSYVAGSTSVERARVPDGLTQTVASFTDLSDMCSFTVVPALNRWYFHHEFDSQFTAVSGENVGYCSASWSSP